jgi:hypothetical protein
MKSAFSKGEFFDTHIRDRYAFKRRAATTIAKPRWLGRDHEGTNILHP